VVLLFEDELDGSAGIRRLVKMACPESSRREIVWDTYHEGGVVLDKSIGTTRHHFDLGGFRRHSGHSDQKAEQGGEREEFREHH
jgi:hypothetical protein